MTKVLVCIPHLTCRAPYLRNALRSYRERTPLEYTLSVSQTDDAPSAGDGWNTCIEDADWDWDYVHFSNDDICVGTGWLPPLIEAVDRGFVPALRIEPAGGHVDEIIYETHPPYAPDYYPVPRDKNAYFYCDHAENQPRESYVEIDHGNLPFCSREQWDAIGPFPPVHYGTDRYFAVKAREAGWPTVAVAESVAFNYNAHAGRHHDGWTETDFQDFDGVFAIPEYISGARDPSEPHPQRLTPEGLAAARSWRAQHEAAQ